jgi:hypothetical protein
MNRYKRFYTEEDTNNNGIDIVIDKVITKRYSLARA